jgi:hypothetical protein
MILPPYSVCLFCSPHRIGRYIDGASKKRASDRMYKVPESARFGWGMQMNFFVSERLENREIDVLLDIHIRVVIGRQYIIDRTDRFEDEGRIRKSLKCARSKRTLSDSSIIARIIAGIRLSFS